MANILNKIEVASRFKHLQIREIKDDGGFHRRVLNCGDDVSGEVQEIQDKAGELWNDELKEEWIDFQAEQMEQIRSKQNE